MVKNGDPVLDAQRVDVEYALRDIFPGGQHRFGFAAIAIQKPVLTITRHADGTLTFNRTGGTSGAAPAPTRKAAAPYYFTVRVRDGVIRLVDVAPLQPDLANQSIENVAIDASVKSDARTTAKLDGVLVARRAPGAAGRALSARRAHRHRRAARDRAQHDHRAHAAAARRARVLHPLQGGAVRRRRARRTSTRATTRSRRKRIRTSPTGWAGAPTCARAASSSVRSRTRSATCDAPLVITDEMLAATSLDGTLNGVPVRGRGAMFDLFSKPAFRMALAANGDLHDLRSLFSFSAKMPLTGGAHLETVLESNLAQPLIRTYMSAARVSYARFPVEALDGVADYYDNAVVINGLQGRYGTASLRVGGRVLFNDAGDDVWIALSAHGPGASLPYASALAPDADVIATVLLTQPPGDAFSARGTIGAVGATTGAGTFAVDTHGVGEFGPFEFNRAGGESLAGGFELQRPISQSAGWLHARGFRLADVRKAPMLPGAVIAALPPIAGVIDGDFAGGGTPDAFGLAGAMSGRDLRFGPYALGSGSVRLGGTLQRRAPERDPTWPARWGGSTAGVRTTAGCSRSKAATTGRSSSCARSRPTPAPAAPSTARCGRRSRRTASSSRPPAPICRARACAAWRSTGSPGRSRWTARSCASLRPTGRSAGARSSRPTRAARSWSPRRGSPRPRCAGAGLPLQGGTLALYGLADIRGHAPAFDGVAAVEDGRAAGYPVSGTADFALADGTASIRSGVASLGGTYGTFDGSVGGIGTTGPGALAYDLNARVPIGDVAEVRRALRLPVKYLEGSFSAQVRVRGNGARPRVAGDVAVPEGSYNGLAFRDARAGVAITPSSVAASNGVVTVGSTHAQIDAGAVDRAARVLRRRAQREREPRRLRRLLRRRRDARRAAGASR